MLLRDWTRPMLLSVSGAPAGGDPGGGDPPGGGEPPAGGGGGSGDPPVPMGMPDFAGVRAAMPAGVRENPIFDQYGEGDKPRGLAGLFEDHIGAQKFIGGAGEMVPLPKSDSPPEVWAAYYKSGGRPDTPEGYDLTDFKPPEGMVWEPELQKRMVDSLHKRGLSQTQMRGALDDFAMVRNEIDVAQQLQSDTLHAEAMSRLEAGWGLEFKGRKEKAESAFRHAFGDNADIVGEFILPDGHKLGSHPLIIEAFDRLGQGMKEDGIIDGGRGGGGGATGRWTPDAAKAEIEVMEREHMKTILDKNEPGHKEKRALWVALLKAANPD